MTIRSYHQKSSERLNFNNTVPDPAPPASAPFRLSCLSAERGRSVPLRAPSLRPPLHSTAPLRYPSLNVEANYGHNTRRKPKWLLQLPGVSPLRHDTRQNPAP